MEFTIVNVEPKQAITIRDHSTAAVLANLYDEIYGQLSGIMKKQSLGLASPPFGIYHSFSPEDVDVEAGIPVTGSPAPEGRMNVIKTYGGKAVLLKFYGPYSNLHEGWDAMMNYVNENKLESSAPPFEVYVTDPASEPDPTELLTEIYYPVK